tara:strand:+ start:11262 stop:11453 length:192 start_codon:yes stop_codon:yes gene_type:complete
MTKAPVKVADFEPQDEYFGELYLQNDGLYFHDYPFDANEPNKICKLISISRLENLIKKYKKSQ